MHDTREVLVFFVGSTEFTYEERLEPATNYRWYPSFNNIGFNIDPNEGFDTAKECRDYMKAQITQTMVELTFEKGIL